jgi:hypothetical protein
MSKSSITFGILFSLGVHALVFWPQIQQAEVVLEMTEPDDPDKPVEDSEDARVAVRVMPLPIPIEPQPDPEPIDEQPMEPPAPEVQPEPAPEINEQLEAQPEEIAVEWQAEVPEEPQEVVAQPTVAVDEPLEPEALESEPATQTLADSTPALQEVVKPSASSAAAVAEPGSSAEPDDDALPTLRIEWSSARQLKNVARTLGMRIIAVDDRSDIVGEVSLLGTPALVPFNGRLSNFSNRVRTLARNYFGPADRWEGGERVASLWILVPAGIDRSFADTQRDAIRDAGRSVGDVRTTEGRFEAWADTYRLVITRVI